MGRLSGQALVMLAIALVLANAGCFARCIVEYCQDSPPHCHSHSTGDAGHCPQQNQVKTAVINGPAIDWGSGFIPVDWVAELTQAEQPYICTTSSVTQPVAVPAPLALRI